MKLKSFRCSILQNLIFLSYLYKYMTNTYALHTQIYHLYYLVILASNNKHMYVQLYGFSQILSSKLSLINFQISKFYALFILHYYLDDVYIYKYIIIASAWILLGMFSFHPLQLLLFIKQNINPSPLFGRKERARIAHIFFRLKLQRVVVKLAACGCEACSFTGIFTL